IAPKESGKRDWVGAFAVTAGSCLDAGCARFERDHDDYSRILAEAPAGPLAEGAAERLPGRGRNAVLGYAPGGPKDRAARRAAASDSAASGRRPGTPRAPTTRKSGRCLSCSTYRNVPASR